VVATYAQIFLRANGVGAIIESRSPAVSCQISMSRATKTVRDLAARDAFWDGMVEASCNIQSGEVIVLPDYTYLVQTSEQDWASGECHFFCVRSNAILAHQRQVEAVSAGNLVMTWAAASPSVYAYGEMITAALRQYDPGLLPQSKYLFQIPKSLDCEMLDRVVLNGNNYQIDSVDDVILVGLNRLQCSTDTRP
jgi:hypothetical protein